VIRRLYINNYRGLDNFELSIAGQSAVLLIGKNGVGKSTVRLALEILQRIARGTTQVRDLVEPKDFTREHTDAPMRFEIEVDLEGKICEYVVAFVLPPGSDELVVFEEKLSIGGQPVYDRKSDRSGNPLPVVPAERLASRGHSISETMTHEAASLLTRRIMALPIFGDQRQGSMVSVFTRWLARMIILAPIPSLITGDSDRETLEPDRYGGDFGAWFSGLLAVEPSAYVKIEEYLKLVMRDLKAIRNPAKGRGSRSIEVQFSNDQGTMIPRFQDLSDGEKCFMVCALVLASAASDAYRPAFCFWDEPDNYLAPDEVQDFVISLRRAFLSGGQFIATSHNPEGIRCFSDENTLVLFRKNHFEPTIVRPRHTLQVHGDLVDAFTRGDLVDSLTRGDVEP
jgi:predicted ATPase